MAEPVDHRVVDVDMDVDPVAVTAPDVDDRIEGAVGDLDQGVGFGGAGGVALEQGVLGFFEGGVQHGAVVGVELTAQLPTAVVEMPQRHELDRIHHTRLTLNACHRFAAGIVLGDRIGREVVRAHHTAQLRHRRQRGELTQLGISPTGCFGHDRRDLIHRQLPASNAANVTGNSPRRRANATNCRAWVADSPAFHDNQCAGEMIPYICHAPVSNASATRRTSSASTTLR